MSFEAIKAANEPQLIHVRVPSDLHAELQKRAAQEDRRVAQLVRLALRRYLAEAEVA